MGIRARLRKALGGGNLPAIALLSSLQGAREHMYYVIWQPFALSRGIPMRSLGGLESALDLTRISFHPVFGGASDAVGRKRFLALRELLIVTASALFILGWSWHTLLIGVLLVGLSYAVWPVWSTLVAESAETRELGRAYSLVNALYMGAGLFAPLVAGTLATSYGYASVFYLLAGIALAGLLMVHFKLTEARFQGDGARITGAHITEALVGALRPPPHLRGFYLSMTVDLFAFGMGHRLLFGMLTRSYGYTPYMLSLLATAFLGVLAIAQIPLGRVVDRVGYKWFLIASELVSCGVFVGLLVSRRLGAVLLMQAVMGISAALWVPAEQAWIARNVSPEGRGRAIASYATFRGLLAFPAPFIGGTLYDAFGFNVPILLNLIGAFAAAILIASLVRGRAS